MSTTSTFPAPRALYCRSTGRRLRPIDGLAPGDGQPVAVLVLDDGSSTNLVGDSVVGRDPDIDRRVRHAGASPVVITDPTMVISRSHVLLRIRGWRVDVIDVGSQNGTFVETSDDGWVRCVPGLAHALSPSGRIRLGERVLSVHPLAPG